MKTKILVSMVAVALTASACGTTAVVDLNHAYTTLGYINSSQIRLAYLYLWDISSGTLRLVDQIPLTQANLSVNNEPQTNLTATFDRGATFQGNVNLTAVQLQQLSFEVSRRFSLTTQGAFDQQVRSSISAITDRINADPAAAERNWFLRDAFANPTRYRYVLASRVFGTNRTEVRVDGTVAAGGQATIQAQSAQVNLEFNATAAVSCVGEQAACFVNFYIFVPRYSQTGNYDFGLDTADNVDALRAALVNGLQ